MKNWKKKWDKMHEENETFGLPYDDNADKLSKQFITNLLKAQRDSILDEIEGELVGRDKFWVEEAINKIKELKNKQY